MKLKSRIILEMSVLLIGFFAVVGWYLNRTEFAVGRQFNAGLYAAEINKGGSFSYDDYAATLKDYVDNKGMVAYRKMKEHHKRLDDFLFAIRRLELKTYQSWDDKAKVAFWINAYNALTLKVILDHIRSKQDSSQVWPTPPTVSARYRGFGTKSSSR